MHSMIIQDLNFLEEQSDQQQIVCGGYSQPKVSTSFSTSVTTKKNVDVKKTVSRNGYKLDYSFDATVELGAGMAGAAAGSIGDVTYTTTVTSIY